MTPLADTGRVIAGRYRLEEPVGRGAMGVVWRARDQLLDRDVAVKEVQIADTLTEDERANAYQRTLREAKTAARLSHPAVVSVFDVANDGGRPWIVMELVNARSLDQVLAADGPLSPQQTAEMGRQLLSALTVAHSAGVLHRDVKPSNVLLGTDGRAVLTDFGIATFQGDPKLTQTGMVMGSPGFTAPERIRGGEATPASDLWSLGATLYAAVEGHGPYESRGGAMTTMSAIINEDAPPAPAAGALGRVIGALLRREPADRPDAATASRMISDVLHLLPDRPPGPTGYAPTAMSAAPLIPPVLPASPVSAASAEPFLSRGLTSEVPQSATPPTTPQPAFADPGPTWADPLDQPAPRFNVSAAPDFSSWYDPSPRSASRSPGGRSPGGHSLGSPEAGASGWPSAEPAGPSSWARPPGGPRRSRFSGLRWKVALAALAVIGAGAGAATVIALRNHNQASPSAQRTNLPATGSASTGTGTGTGTPTSINQAIDEPESASGPLPDGFKSYRQAASVSNSSRGFQLAYPSGFAVVRSGLRQTKFVDSQLNTYLLVDLTPHTYPDMLAEARYIERQSIAKGSFPGYQVRGLARLSIRGRPGAYWKFIWNDNGVEQEVLDLMYIAGKPSGRQQSYALYFTAPTSDWNAMHAYFDEEARTFAPLPPL